MTNKTIKKAEKSTKERIIDILKNRIDKYSEAYIAEDESRVKMMLLFENNRMNIAKYKGITIINKEGDLTGIISDDGAFDMDTYNGSTEICSHCLQEMPVFTQRFRRVQIKYCPYCGEYTGKDIRIDPDYGSEYIDETLNEPIYYGKNQKKDLTDLVNEYCICHGVKTMGINGTNSLPELLKKHICQKTFVYIITNGIDSVKIGIAKNPEARLRQLQTSNQHKLTFVDLFYTDTRDDAEILEREFHKLFSEYRLNGEWFKMTPVIDWLEKQYEKEEFNVGQVNISKDKTLSNKGDNK